MDELIARIEAASGGSRELDWEIHLRDGLDGVGAYGLHPYYTSSIDAALTLRPNGWILSSVSEFSEGRASACWTLPAKIDCGTYAATPPLALCAAALRARQS